MLPYPPTDLDPTKLEELCRSKFPESTTLDFKQTIPGPGGAGVAEIAKDVSAMANADGGDLIFGVAEADGAADKLTPLVGETSDEAMRRLIQVIDSNIEPRIRGIQMRSVNVTGGYVLMVRVPQSFEGPHCIRNANQRRFVIRNGTTTSDMNFEQVRMAFDRTSTLVERATKLIESRNLAVRSRATLLPMPDNFPVSAFQFVPISSIAGRTSVDVASLNEGDYNLYVPAQWRRASLTHRLNRDGLVAHQTSRGPTKLLLTMFRDGRYEALKTTGWVDEKGEEVIHAEAAMNFYRESLEAALSLCKAFGISGPALVGTALFHIGNYKFQTAHDIHFMGPTSSDRPHLELPEIWIEDVSVELDAKTLLSEAADVLWQSFNNEKAYY